MSESTPLVACEQSASTRSQSSPQNNAGDADDHDELMPAPSKRIKRDVSEFDVEVSVDEMLAKFVESRHGRRANNNDASPSDNRDTTDELTRLQTEVDQLQALQNELNLVFQHRLKAKRRKTTEIKRQKIPLFSLLNDDILLNLSDFLSDRDFLNLEDSVMNFLPSRPFNARWLAVKGADQFKSGLLSQRLGNRVARFREASDFARRMQTSAERHYDANFQHQRGSYEWPQQLYSKEDFCSDFKSFQGRNRELCRTHFFNEQTVGTVPETEFFVRMTYKEDDGSESVLLEGFRPPKVAATDNPKGNYTTMGFTDSNTFLSMRFCDVTSYSPDKLGLVASDDGRRRLSFEDQWPTASRKAFLDRVSITVLACYMQKGCPLSPRLVVSTRGYFSEVLNIGYMQPRPLKAYSRIVGNRDERNCVNVGFFSYPRKFGILLKWGYYNN